MQNTFNKALAIVALSTIAGTVVYAWTGPTGTAPNNNVAAPINVSSNAQTKAGALTVDSLTTSGVGGIQNNSQASYGPVKLESWGIGNTGGSGNIYMEPKPGSTFYIVPNDWSNNLTTHIRGKIEFGSGSETSYGAVTMKGEKNSYSGINFKNGSWANSGTLMMHPSYSGFYNNSDTNWRWYTDNSGNTYQPGIGQATDFCVYGTSKCLSTVSGSVGPQGPAGPQGPQGPAGSQVIGGYSFRGNGYNNFPLYGIGVYDSNAGTFSGEVTCDSEVWGKGCGSMGHSWCGSSAYCTAIDVAAGGSGNGPGYTVSVSLLPINSVTKKW